MRTTNQWLRLVLVALAFTAFSCGGGGDDGGDDSPTIDANTNPPIDAAIDAPPGDASLASVTCGEGVTCNPPGEVCCIDDTGPHCVLADTCQGDTIGCDSASDCVPGEVCCVRTGGGGDFEAACGGQCQTDVIACTDAATDCGQGQSCCDTTLGYSACLDGACP